MFSLALVLVHVSGFVDLATQHQSIEANVPFQRVYTFGLVFYCTLMYADIRHFKNPPKLIFRNSRTQMLSNF
jgi:hypothetical protein